MNRSNSRLVIYIAGPEVFLPNAADVGETKKAICHKHGFDGRFPSNDSLPNPHFQSGNVRLVFGDLVGMMMKSDLIVANMTPFRGPSVDAGTAMEIGFMHARGCPVFGYTNVAGMYAERVAPEGGETDSDGRTIEPFDLTDNLMCVGPMFKWGTLVVHDVPEEDRFTDLRGFEECVQQAELRLLR